MGKIGNFGDIEFYVKTKNGRLMAQSFEGMKWDTSINVEEHKRQRKKPLLEVTGKNCDEISMNIYFYASLGVNPWKKLLKLRRYNLEGKVFPLKIGSRRIGNYKWVIVKVSNDLKLFYKNGKVMSVMSAVTFKEYPYKKGSKKKKKVKNKKKSSSKAGDGKTSGSSGKRNKKGYIAYVVKKGDTLWALAKKYYKSGVKYTKIYNANKTKTKGFNVITNPDKILPGWKIKIPL